MSEVLSPTLEDLRQVPEPAWLWDGARARLVWANAAGIAWFGGATLFDLIDRPFDLQEGGVARIAALSRSLRHGQVESCLLHFPSVRAAPIACRCMAHALPDGRIGVLVVATASPAVDRATAQAEMAAAFDLMPTPAVLIGADGRIRELNAAAMLLLGGGQRAALQAILGAEAADDLIARVGEAGTVTIYKALTLRFGARDMRIVARRLTQPGGDAAFAMILLDDVTERRVLERQLQQPAAAQPPASDAEAFERLAEILRRETAAPARAETTPVIPSFTPQPAPAPVKPQRQPQALPPILNTTLEATSDAMLIAQHGRLLYANGAACALFGYGTPLELLNDERIWTRFAQLGQPLPPADIMTDTGRIVTASVAMRVIPWLGGPAREFIVHPVPQAAALSTPTPTIAEPPAAAAPAPQQQFEFPATPAAVREPAPPVDAPQAPAEEPVPAVEAAPPATVARAEADAELRAILDTVADGIITLDAKGGIHSFSAGAEAIFGYRISEVLGRPFLELFAADSRKTVRDYLAALQGPGSLASVFNDGREVNAQVKQGGAVPLFLTLGRLQAAQSEAALCAVVRDITQWKKTEEELRQARDTAVATSRQKSEFLARISHELRTPLNAIMGFSEVMRLQRFGKMENDKYLGYANDIHSSGSHLLSLINDLLDLSKVEAGKFELNFTSVGLEDVTDHVLRMMQEPAAAARVVLRKAMPANLPHVVADLRSMRQILLNLVSNALKFTDPGGQVIISAVLTPAGELKLRVKDTGIGMNEDQLRDAMEPFSRVTTDGRDAPGTGLGLPLTKALAEANRTQFAISSEPRKGTLAEITFPTTRVLAG